MEPLDRIFLGIIQPVMLSAFEKGTCFGFHQPRVLIVVEK